MPDVSVIVTAYNSEDTVERAVRSVLDQDFSDVELIVVADGSSDATREVIAAIDDERLTLLDEAENRGPGGSRNRGLEVATGRWIAFLDSDDEYEPGYLRTMIDASAGVDIVCCRHYLIRPDGARQERGPRVSPGELSGPEIGYALLENRITPFVWDKLFRSEVLSADQFPENLHRGEDAVASLKACLAANRLRVIPDLLHRYYVSANSLSWGRVSPLKDHDAGIAESRRAMTEDSQRARQALAVSTILTYTNAANQAIVSDDPHPGYVRRCAKRISWRTCLRALRRSPFLAACAAALKALPGVYSTAYRAYVRRRYSL